MDFQEFLTQVIDEGIEATKVSYACPEQQYKLQGSIAGFEACRGRNTDELRELLAATATATQDARRRKAFNYWWYRCYEAEVEWVCNCVSALLHYSSMDTIVRPTSRGLMKMAKILGIKEV